jgi:hypothetical protein
MESFRFLTLVCFLCCFFSTNSNAQFSSEKRFYPLIESTSDRDTSFSRKPSTVKGLTLTEVPNCVLLSRRSFSKSSSLIISDNAGTFSGKWERLTGKPIFDTSMVFYSPLKSTNSTGVYNSKLYRTGANIFNMVMIAKYPYYPRTE